MKTLLFYLSLTVCLNACQTTQKTATTNEMQSNTTTQNSAQDTVTKPTTKNTQPLQEEITHEDGVVAMYPTEEEALDENFKVPAKLTISNKTNAPITLNMAYEIEQFKDGKWSVLPFCKDLLFEEALYTISPSKTADFPFSFHKDKYTYEKGKYRIVKDYDTPAPNGKRNVIIYTEFVVE